MSPKRSQQERGHAGGEVSEPCAACGGIASKKCSRCKRVRSSPLGVAMDGHPWRLQTPVAAGPGRPSHKTFRINKKLANKMRQNRPIPYWIRMRTDNTIRYNAKHRHWCRTKLGF
ncbi:hypothetical protein C2845_PM09G12990 [Panicum miliaceum]|uniref:60S ribosomal protein L39 n=1 Tax=Panicum miliaceum TaxID=4540 RepID=A0A3L6RW96_PANMI|nr:hypothetical protein C2845_PM09G12990 [Panicum miliaceum]